MGRRRRDPRSVQALERSWRDDMPRVLVYARRRVGSERAEDVVAETYAAAWRHWERIPPDPFPYLIGIARNIVASEVRVRRRSRDVVVRLLLDVASTLPHHVDPAERLIAIASLAELSDQDREAVLLSAWDGLSDEQAGQVLGIRPATFRKRLSRARARLRTLSSDQSPLPVSVTRRTYENR